jgi:hypothetical protein
MTDDAKPALDDAELHGQGAELLADRSAMSVLTMPGETPGIVPEGDGTVYDGQCFPDVDSPEQEETYPPKEPEVS